MITQEVVDLAEKQIYELQQEVAYDTREFTIEYIVDKYRKGAEMEQNEIFVPEYQRDFVWDEERQSKFVESILLGLPIPFIFVAELRESGRFEIVDGSQRIRTLAAFLNNDLELVDLEKLTKVKNFKFKDFSIPRQRKFKNTPMRMIVLTDKASEDVRNDMFERINRGSDLLKDMEKRKGIYKGNFNNFIYDLCKTNEKFKRLTPIIKWLQKRQELEELVLRFFALSENYNNYPPYVGIASYLDNYLEEKNKTFSDNEKLELTKNFNNMVDFVEKYFEYGFAKSRLPQISRVHFEAVSVGVHLALTKNPNLVTTRADVNKWLYSSRFKEMISGKYHTHTPRRIKERIEFVKNNLLDIV